MTDVAPPLDEQQGTPSPPRPAETSALRLILLLLVFGVALACLLYDYTIARPAIQQATAKIEGLLDGSRPDPDKDGTVTDAEVQDVLGRTPTQVKALENGKVEVYSWRSGLPYRTYDLYVVYTGRKTPLLYASSTNREPTADRLPPSTVIPTEMSEEANRDKPKGPTAAPMGPAPGGPKETSDRKPRTRPEGKRGGGGGGAPAIAKPAEPGDAAPPDAPAPGLEPSKDQPTPPAEPPKEEPAPAAEPAQDQPTPPSEPAPAESAPPPAEPTNDQPAEGTPPAGDQPAKEQPPETPSGEGQG